MLGVASTLGFLGAGDPALYWLAGVLAIASNVFNGAASVVRLPARHPKPSEYLLFFFSLELSDTKSL